MLDIEEDYLIFDGLEKMILIQAGTNIKTEITGGLPLPITTRDVAASDGTYTQGDSKFSLPKKECSFFDPRPGDFIKDAAKTLWTLQAVETLTLKTRFLCWGKRADLNPGTLTQVKIWKPETKKDATGAAFKNWKLIKDVSAHVNENVSETIVEVGRKRLKITHRIYVVDPIEKVQAGFRVTNSAGLAWNVIRVTNKGTAGEATILDVETSRSPMTDG